MHPAKLKSGDKVMVAFRGSNSSEREAIFEYREPAQGKGRPAKNLLRFPHLNNELYSMSDYALSRCGRLVKEVV